VPIRKIPAARENQVIFPLFVGHRPDMSAVEGPFFQTENWPYPFFCIQKYIYLDLGPANRRHRHPSIPGLY
jgi:hypothetical protein